ncbi:MAG: hypothetical protein U0168_10275 [Nannocystaceae bacterium]
MHAQRRQLLDQCRGEQRAVGRDLQQQRHALDSLRSRASPAIESNSSCSSRGSPPKKVSCSRAPAAAAADSATASPRRATSAGMRTRFFSPV